LLPDEPQPKLQPASICAVRKSSGSRARGKAGSRIQNALAGDRRFDIFPPLNVRELAMIEKIERIEREHRPIAFFDLEILGEPHVDAGNLGDVQAADRLERDAAA
jgi:hypothetical protein